MTKKLEELFNLPNEPDEGLPNEVTPDNVPEAKPENNPIMQNTLSELDKVPVSYTHLTLPTKRIV